MTFLNNDAPLGRGIRRFEDSDGVVWAVREEEVDDVVLSFETAKPETRVRRCWLYFRSPIATRRLAEFPDEWGNMAPGELEQLLRKSIRAPK